MSEARRILVIDDSEAIHQDFRRLLCPERSSSRGSLALLEGALFGTAPSRPEPAGGPVFELDSAFQGRDGLALAQKAQEEGRPYALAFLDYRMPPGWSGVETLRHLWKAVPSLRVVFCSAYSDYSWGELMREFGESPLLRELRKPFDSQELRQLALALSAP
jgi:CheY-like chemotaxis protein